MSKGTPKITTQLPINGLPGQNGNYIVVPIFPIGDPRNHGGPDGLPGKYEVTFTLNRPGYPLRPERSSSSGDNLEGDSHLQVAAHFRIDANVEGETFTFEGRPNSRKFLAALVVRCDAQGVHDAHNKCYRAIMPILSGISLKWDVPLAIYQIDVHELRTGVRGFSHRNPLAEVKVSGEFRTILDPEPRTYAAIYREAIITESPAYQFLCFYRIIESLKARRTRIARAAIRERRAYTQHAEVYPRNAREAVDFELALPSGAGLG
jgi:hypothetical protein